ncbi:hypothetical protein [Nocardia amamiensis]|uniref:hypothetical protein n=1 Tax=Nocardia amamiensis TaxID=404578 RepID=UPI000B2991EB|nr:hypothetical protein [Nocardia amamiensis]
MGWWRRVRPDRADQAGVKLEQLRVDAVAARGSGDTATEDALAGVWRLRLHRLVTLLADKVADTEIRRAAAPRDKASLSLVGCATYPWKRQMPAPRGSAMSSFEELYNKLIAKSKLLGPDPDPDRLRALREELDQLDYRIRVEVPAGDRYYELNLLSRQANACLTAADNRAQIARNVARAEHEREAHDAANPTILSPRSGLADWTPNAIIQSERNRREGIERER